MFSFPGVSTLYDLSCSFVISNWDFFLPLLSQLPLHVKKVLHCEQERLKALQDNVHCVLRLWPQLEERCYTFFNFDNGIIWFFIAHSLLCLKNTLQLAIVPLLTDHEHARWSTNSTHAHVFLGGGLECVLNDAHLHLHMADHSEREESNKERKAENNEPEGRHVACSFIHNQKFYLYSGYSSSRNDTLYILECFPHIRCLSLLTCLVVFGTACAPVIPSLPPMPKLWYSEAPLKTSLALCESMKWIAFPKQPSCTMVSLKACTQQIGLY